MESVNISVKSLSVTPVRNRTQQSDGFSVTAPKCRDFQTWILILTCRVACPESPGHRRQSGPTPVVHAFPCSGRYGTDIGCESLTCSHVFVRILVHPVLTMRLPAHVVESRSTRYLVSAARRLQISQHQLSHLPQQNQTRVAYSHM